MKTKIIYISGNEIFNIADIRTAFEEVRNALQLGTDTVLFGVPVDTDDAGFGTSESEETIQSEPVDISEETQITEPVIEDIDNPAESIVVQEPENQKQKRSRSRKKSDPNQNIESDNTIVNTPVEQETEKVVPILSVLSGKEDENEPTEITTEEKISEDTVEIIQDNQEMENDVITEIDAEPETENIGEPDLEKLLSSMTPLQEDALEDDKSIDDMKKITDDIQSDDVDATLEQLATEFAEAQDKIASETKSSGRSKIGKLRNILPFKQSKHKDQGLGDLFGWAGVAANDEDFSVPGFFTNATSKK
ncbi:MAG: hypothetical protein IJL05_00945 [Alphaproteobacteria bacterium]|nr:hypothetical protein [Alphaproteobacteria bacterium]